MLLDMWADHYAKEGGDVYEDDDFDVDALVAQAEAEADAAEAENEAEQWEEIEGLTGDGGEG